MNDGLTPEEAAVVIEVLETARTGETNETHFRYALGHEPALSSAIRKLTLLAGTPRKKSEWLLSKPKKLTDLDDS